MATVTIDTHILAQISLIAGRYQVYIGQNVQTGEITAENFHSVGKLILFMNNVESFLNTLDLRSFTIRTRYNPYEVDINWRK